MRSSLLAGALGAAFLVARPPGAHAAELTLSGPSACRDREELTFRVERALESPLSAAPELDFDVTIEPARQGYTARLRVREAGEPAPSERALEAADCERLLDALSVVIVLAIDRVREQGAEHEPGARPEAASPPTPAEPPARASPSSADSAVTDAKSAGPGLRPAVLAWLAGDIGSLPEPDLGVGVGLLLDGPRVRWQASGLFFFEQHSELSVPGTPPPGADLALALGALSACYAPDGSWQSDGVIGVCARGELGRLFGRGTDVREQRSGGRLWVAPGLSLAGAWRVLSPSIRLAVEAGAVLPLLRSEFRLGTLGALYRPAAVSVRAGLGVEIVLE